MYAEQEQQQEVHRVYNDILTKVKRSLFHTCMYVQVGRYWKLVHTYISSSSRSKRCTGSTMNFSPRYSGSYSVPVCIVYRTRKVGTYISRSKWCIWSTMIFSLRLSGSYSVPVCMFVGPCMLVGTQVRSQVVRYVHLLTAAATPVSQGLFSFVCTQF